MTLNAFVADKKLKIFEDLVVGRAPREGSYDAALLREAQLQGKPQMGSTTLAPNLIHLEYIYPVPRSSAMVIHVEITPPERIVFMPVPEWIIENIWQGDVAGSAHFESDAMRMLEEYRGLLDPEANRGQFGERDRVGRG